MLGKNDTGQIGDGTFINRLTAVELRAYERGRRPQRRGRTYLCPYLFTRTGSSAGAITPMASSGDGSTTNHNTPETISALSSGVDSSTPGPGIPAC